MGRQNVAGRSLGSPHTGGFAEFLALATALPSAQQQAQATLPPGAPRDP